MNLRKRIRELVAVMREEELAEIEVRRWFTTVRVRRPGADTAMPVQAVAPAEAAERRDGDEKQLRDLVPIKSPMVGTFYRAPAPDADPYVEENSSITVGQTVCIVEAMKLMNEIESEVGGRIARILVENAQPVEYGQTLFLVEADTAA
ncbi:MAG: acetyl-CoA carboxylase biotin carboxyl carrier protein [Candidatus Eisenbacteria bacterium]|uniref:Biotin carboxyl carrier protein of acetyl-CoA carboxylase n=1 Tax=Eiseniibacteriota bacterium TaxID=2212470 RepID=A0A538T8J1_UNCEI|nr:MAG: acetyl-CoA carboxylase biotin carboxyl carrier protein [Candidatus Eisenbacteria bacterium]